jgi:hypothetical protein
MNNKKYWVNQDRTEKIGLFQWKGNDLKVPVRELLASLHQGSHWWTQPMSDTVLQAYGYIWSYTLPKQVLERCLTGWKMSKQVLTQRPAWDRNPRLWPFQSIQVDYTEML